MKHMAAIFFISLLTMVAHPALAADQAQAREVARMNNCVPKKIEVYQQSLGVQAATIYHVDCNMPKMTGADTAGGPSALLISCDQNLCELLRPVQAEKK